MILSQFNMREEYRDLKFCDKKIIHIKYKPKRINIYVLKSNSDISASIMSANWGEKNPKQTDNEISAVQHIPGISDF